jgi:uncharacterized NAD(P)/FAD-binding protein YdhS
MDIEKYDLAIVGSGIACARSICELAERLKHKVTRGRMLRIAIIERERDLWNGIPYGSRSSIGALAFQRLQEFLEEPERTYYIDWLTTHAGSWLRTFTEFGGPGAARWISDNRRLIGDNKWGELYLPRFLFGLYVSKEASHAVEELTRSGVAKITPIHREAVGICRMPGRQHTIALEDSAGIRTSIQAARIVLAIGSPPQKTIHRETVDGRLGHLHIDNIYSPSEDVSIRKIQHALSCVPEKSLANILVLGSNASALEVLYLIRYRPEIRNFIHSVVVLSRSGLLPYKICEQKVDYELAALDALRRSNGFAAADLMSAISSDIHRAEHLALNIADLRDPVGAAVSRLTAMMVLSEQKKFVCEHGNNYSRMMRRAGRDTRTAADDLVNAGILTTAKGEFRRFEPCAFGEGVVSAIYTTTGSHAELTFPTPFSITVNCGGFEELDFCSSPLINSVIGNKICRVNSTNRGFYVDDKLEASEDVFVIGPLVAGNFNEKLRFWHVESASRIVGLAKVLADSLSESFFPSREFPSRASTDLVGRIGTAAVSRYL